MSTQAFPDDIERTYGSVLKQIESHYARAEVSPKREFTDGKSGARVFLVSIVPEDDDTSVEPKDCILKLDRPVARKGPKERERHQTARRFENTQGNHFAKAHIPTILSDFSGDDGYVGILFEIAGGGFSDYVSADQLPLKARKQFWSQLSEDLLKYFSNQTVVVAKSKQCSAQDCLREWLGHRVSNQGLRRFVEKETQCGTDWFLPRGIYQYSNLYNPIVFYDKYAHHYLDDRLRGLQHKDLNCGNLVVNKTDVKEYWILDFAMADADSYLCYDHAYLEMSLLLKKLASDKISRSVRLLAILDALDNVPDNRLALIDAPDPDYQIVELLSAGRELVDPWVKKSWNHYSDQFKKQMLLARIAAGLAWAFMNIPDHDRQLALYYSAWYAGKYQRHHHREHPAAPPLETQDDGQPAGRTTSLPFRSSMLPLGFTQMKPALAQGGLVHTLAWSPHGVLAVGNAAGEVRLWNLHNSVTRVLKGHKLRVNALAWSPDGKRLASGSEDRTIQLWDIENGRDDSFSLLSDVHTKAIETLAWLSPKDGPNLLASGSDDGSICLWNIDKNAQSPSAFKKSLGDTVAHRKEVMSCAWSPRSPILASAGYDGRCLLWDLSGEIAPANPRMVFSSRQALVCVVWSPEGSSIFTGTSDPAIHTIQMWDTTTNLMAIDQPHTELEGHLGPISSVAISPDGFLLASKSKDDTVRIWRRCRLNDDKSWETVAILEEPASKAFPVDIAFHKDDSGLVLATLGDEGESVRVWRIEGSTSHPLDQ